MHCMTAIRTTKLLRSAAILLPLTVAASSITLARALDAELPDTHAGRCAAAYIEAFNSDDNNAVRAFEQRYRAKSSLKARSMEDRLAQHRELKEDWGQLTVRRVVESKERELTLYVDPSDWPGTLMFRFDFEGQEPYGLLGILIEGPVDPGEFAEESEPLDGNTRRKAIDAVIDSLNRAYVYPEVAKKMETALRRHVAEGRYEDVSASTAFASKLTQDLQAVSRDLHLTIRAGRQDESCGAGLGDGHPMAQFSDDYGFKKAEVLPGNIGYLKFNMFLESDAALNKAAEMMAMLADCDALIFDLRDNTGGSPEMIKFLSSYLFDKPTHLNSFYNRLNDKTSETWTLEEVPGQRFGASTPVYVVTSNRTGSAAEEFTYNLKHLKRATIVGETTVGAAHPVEEQDIIGRFKIRVPYARAYNPITKKNWEGVGVSPHVEARYGAAVDKAVELALAEIQGAREVKGKNPSP